MERIEQACWVFYLKNKKINSDRNKVGKWMYFFNFEDIDFADKICRTAIEKNIVEECKYQFKKRNDLDNTGLLCFYLNSDDLETHKKVISYMIENNLIKKTKLGKFHNISFKLDSQTRAKEYGENFSSEIKLSNFINLETGEWVL